MNYMRLPNNVYKFVLEQHEVETFMLCSCCYYKECMTCKNNVLLQAIKEQYEQLLKQRR